MEKIAKYLLTYMPSLGYSAIYRRKESGKIILRINKYEFDVPTILEGAFKKATKAYWTHV